MGLGKLGWDNDHDKGNGGGENGSGGYSEAQRMYNYRFYLDRPSQNKIEKNKPVTHRIMFITDVPYKVYEHSMWEFPAAKEAKEFNAICLKKNAVMDECPPCKAARKLKYPFYSGYMQIIDLGQVEFKGGGPKDIVLHHYSKTKKDKETGEEKTVEYRFVKKIIGLQVGSDTKPKRFNKFAEELRRLGHGAAGTVWDVTRSGDREEQVGDTWKFLGKVDGKKMADVLRKYGAKDDEINLTPLPWDGKGGIFNISDTQEYYEHLCEMVGWVSNSKQENAQVDGACFGDNNWNGGNEYSGGFNDDDIPF